MINSDKIIEMNTEELDQISGGIKLSDDQKEKIKGFLCIACCCAIGIAGGCQWVSDTTADNESVVTFKNAGKVLLMTLNGLGVAAVVSTVRSWIHN